MKLGRLEATIADARLTLVGRIDDTSPLGELASQLPAGDLVIDTAGVTFVNSIGMREWLRLLRALTSAQRGVTLERVADVLITQLNLMPSLGPGVRITSFYAQYACNRCGAEAAMLVDAVAHAASLARLQPPASPCAECGSAMELADFPERYLTLFKA